MLASAGCGGGDDDGSTATTAPVDGVAVTAKDFRFRPETVTVEVGETVTWVFAERVAHNVVAKDFKSAILGKGKTFAHTFDRPGTFPYECTLHPGMDGTVEVKPAG